MRALRVIASLAICSLPSIAVAQQSDQPQPVISIIEHTSIPEIFDTTFGEGPKELFIKDPVAQEQTIPVPTPDPRKEDRAQAPSMPKAPK